MLTTVMANGKRSSLTYETEAAALDGIEEIRSHIAADAAGLEPPTVPGVYLILCGDRVKIGRSDNIARRMTERTMAPYPLRLLCYFTEPGLEKALHFRFRHLRAYGEWFHFGPELREFVQQNNHRYRNVMRMSTEEMKAAAAEAQRKRVELVAANGAKADEPPPGESEWQKVLRERANRRAAGVRP